MYSIRFCESCQYYEFSFCGSLHLEYTVVTYTFDAGYLHTSVSLPSGMFYGIRKAESKTRPVFAENIHERQISRN